MDLALLGTFAGGIGLFLIGMRLMTDGLRLAAGDALRRILTEATHTRLRGLVSGIVITSLVQSSSAVTVATIGFVNAGLLNLMQTVSVIYGSNIGTTMTSWLVALVGFKVDVQALALPLIGLGTALTLIGRRDQRGAMGEALAGFGLFFLGIAVLKGAFEDIGQSVELAQWAGNGFGSMLLFTGIGFLLTFLTQSSSAAMAITLSAAAGGLIPFEAAAAVVIGTNVGTTSTAALAVIGATSNARRVAAAHVLFNLLTGAVALLLLPWLVEPLRAAADTNGPATLLALFHTGFNLLGVALLWPFTTRMVRYLETRFRQAEEDLAKPRFLDRNVAGTPSLAVDAMAMELGRIGGIVRRMALSALSTEKVQGVAIGRERVVVEKLAESVDEFAVLLQKSNLSEAISGVLPEALRIGRYYQTAAEIAAEAAAEQQRIDFLEDSALADHLAHFRTTCVHLVKAADPADEEWSPALLDERLAEMTREYQSVKAHLLRGATEEKLSVRRMVGQLDQCRLLRRMGEQLAKAAQHLAELRTVTADWHPAPAA